MRLIFYFMIFFLIHLTIGCNMNKNDTLKALKEFYQSTNKNKWYISDGWDGDGSDFCRFAGISCDQNGFFGIYLQANGLIGEIPDSFGEIECITEINFSTNRLTNLPELSKMKNLSELSISNNQISKMEDFTCLDNLKKLNISSNMLSSLPKLNENLEVLDISFNNISHLDFSLPPTINTLDICYTNLRIDSNNSHIFSSLKNLESLDVSGLKISDYSFLSQLKTLQFLKLNNLNLEEIPPSLYECSELLELELMNNNISIITNQLSLLKNLIYLELKSNQIKDIEVNLSMNSLITLDLSFNKIESSSLTKITQYFQSLKVLSLSNNIITVIPTDVCSSNISLTILDLSFNQIDSLEGFDCVNNLQYLEYLDLENNAIESFPPAMKELTSLRNLYISNNKINSTKYFPYNVTVLRAENNQFYNSSEVSSYFNQRGYPFSYVDLRF